MGKSQARRFLITMVRIADEEKSRQDLLSELVGLRQWNTHLQSEANATKQARAALKDCQLLFDQLFDALGTGVATFSSTKFKRVNRAFAQKMQTDLNEILVKSPLEFFGAETMGQLEQSEDSAKVKIGQVEVEMQVLKVQYQDQPALMLVVD